MKRSLLFFSAVIVLVQFGLAQEALTNVTPMGSTPEIACPENITFEAVTGSEGAIVDYADPVGSDRNEVPEIALIGGLGSGAIFPVGTTTMRWRATNKNGNESKCSFTITVVASAEKKAVAAPVENIAYSESEQLAADETKTKLIKAYPEQYKRMLNECDYKAPANAEAQVSESNVIKELTVPGIEPEFSGVNAPNDLEAGSPAQMYLNGFNTKQD